VWEVEQTPEGGAKVTTELSGDELKAVLTIGLVTLFAAGFAPTSMAHHFTELEDDGKEEVEVPEGLAYLDVGKMTPQ
jgi:hypothetical protein